MPQSARSKNMAAIRSRKVDLIGQFKQALAPAGPPWSGIIEFATSDKFCNLPLYPRQETILKLIYLETENMTAYDLAVIDEWTKHFFDAHNSYGVQPDIWERIKYLKDRGYDHFPHVQAVMGRRASKGLIGGIVGAERAAHMLSLGNPQEYYGVARGKVLYGLSVATNIEQAKKFQFDDIRQAIHNCKWMQPHISSETAGYISLRTARDYEQIIEDQARGKSSDAEVASIKMMAMSSTSTSGRGGASFIHHFDEMAHMQTGSGGPRTAEQVYNAYQPSLDQFQRAAMTYIPSSPFSKVGIFYDLYERGRLLLPGFSTDNQQHEVIDADGQVTKFSADPRMLILQLPSWEPYKDWDRGPELVKRSFKGPIQWHPDTSPLAEPGSQDQARNEAQDPEVFKVEKRAQFAEVIDAYLNPEKVDKMFVPLWDGRILPQIKQGIIGISYEGHADPALVNDDFALAIGHLETSPEPDDQGRTWQHVIIDKTQVWHPADFENHTIDYIQVEQELEQVIYNFNTLNLLTFDQWNSGLFIQLLSQFAKKNSFRTRVREETFQSKRNQEVAEQFRVALNMGWVHAPKDTYFQSEGCLLEQELKFLTIRNGKVDHPKIGPVTHDDLAACVMEVSTRLLRNQLGQLNRDSLNSSPIPAAQNSYPQVNGYERLTSKGSNNRDILGSYASGFGGNSLRSRTRGR